jgi:uncharacterized repeat protein (TIGR03803 family)
LTLGGGQKGAGTAYRIGADGTGFAVLHEFTASDSVHDGRLPARGMLVMGADGAFYGATTKGGQYNMGTLFKMAPDGTVTVLHEFQGGPTDGALPQDQPIIASDGNLYGATLCGGSPDPDAGCGGAVYKYSMAAPFTFTVLRSFTSATLGFHPVASPIEVAGTLVGTTFSGGASGFGTVYTLSESGDAFTVRHDFAGPAGLPDPDGASPAARLLLASDGMLYGTTSLGGPDHAQLPKGDGTIFRMDPVADWAYTPIYAFGSHAPLTAADVPDLAHPMAGLVQGTDGIFGTTDSGGQDLSGGIFRIIPGEAMANRRSAQRSRRQPARAGRALGSNGGRPKRRRRNARAAATGFVLAILAGAASAQVDTDFLEVSKAWHLVVADFDGDGHDDILVGGHDPDDRIWYWSPIGYQPGPFVFPQVDRHACAAADVNGDGMMDLFCMVGGDKGAGNGTKKDELWLQDFPGHFTQKTDSGLEDGWGRGRRPVFLNFDGDALPDLYMTNKGDGKTGDEVSENRMFRNDGNGQFEELQTNATGLLGFACVDKGDIDNDGRDDLLVCQDGANGHIFLNDLGANFNEVASVAVGMWVDAHLVDMNGDGWVDLVDLTSDGHLQIWLNTHSAPYYVVGDGENFDVPVTGGIPVSLTAGDFNNDGKMDVYVVMSRQCSSVHRALDVPDVLFTQDSDTMTWTRTDLDQADLFGCGRLAATVDGNKVLLSNGTELEVGPSYLLDFSH